MKFSTLLNGTSEVPHRFLTIILNPFMESGRISLIPYRLYSIELQRKQGNSTENSGASTHMDGGNNADFGTIEYPGVFVPI